MTLNTVYVKAFLKCLLKLKTSLVHGSFTGPLIQGGLQLFGMITGHTVKPLF